MLHRRYYFSSDAHVLVVLSGYLGAGSVGPGKTISWVMAAHQMAMIIVSRCVQGRIEKQYCLLRDSRSELSFRRLDIASQCIEGMRGGRVKHSEHWFRAPPSALYVVKCP